MNTLEYLDEIMDTFRDYNPIIHTEDDLCRVEIINKGGDNIFIDLDSEITISFGKWHNHYYYEDRYDYEVAMEKVKNLINNDECTLDIYSNNKYFGSGSSVNKGKYTENDALNFLRSFFKNTSFRDIFREYGLTIKVNYWDSSKNYELVLGKEYFS